jgi:hypothetical protein
MKLIGNGKVKMPPSRAPVYARRPYDGTTVGRGIADPLEIK